MLPPIRCYTCGKVIGHLWEEFNKFENKQEFFEKYGIKRYCCRTVFLTTIDQEEIVAKFKVWV